MSESGTPNNRSRKSPTVRGASLSFLPPCLPDRYSRITHARQTFPAGRRDIDLFSSQPRRALSPRLRELSVVCDRRTCDPPCERIDSRQRGWPSIIQAIRPSCVPGASRGADWLLKRAKQSSLHGRRVLLASLSTPFLLTCQLR